MLKYIGDGSFLPGIPARDLSDEEVKQYGEKLLLTSGLYVKSKKEEVLPDVTPEDKEK